MRLTDTLAHAIATLSAGTAPQQARRDAELLLMRALNCTRVFVLTHPEFELTGTQLQHYGKAISRRARGEPIQYITGEQEFYGLRFAVNPDVLIPRPETEHLVEALLERIDHCVPMRIVDVGTGSGAIAVALAKHLPLAEITALDISAAALDVARANANMHEVSGRIRFLRSDLMSAVADEHFDAVISNPPYVSLTERDTLAIEVREHEPGMALFAGVTGLEIYERLVPQAQRILSDDGWLFMEIGSGQRDALERLLKGWNQVAFIADLHDIPRVVWGRRISHPSTQA